jgi:hypothetical protein
MADVWSRRIRQNEEVVLGRLGQAGVLVHLATNRIFELNATGLRIWDLVGQGQSLAAVEQALRAEFEGDPESLRNDILTLVDALTREGLVLDLNDDDSK